MSRMEPSLPVAERPRRPPWMKVRAPSTEGKYWDVRKLLHGASLVTVCERPIVVNIASSRPHAVIHCVNGAVSRSTLRA